ELLGLQERDGEVTLDFSCPATKGEVAFSGLVDEPRVTGGNVVGRHTADQDGLEVFVMEAESRSLRLTVRVAGT
ncbi:MAG: hypothetical protein M1522_02370, partial [Actinobacteria bacterium]|nr:hypothetical protein [Actinomycetota bacterium]